MVGLTDSAVMKFKEFITNQGAGQDAGVRIFIVPGGWSPSLAMDVANNPQSGDTTIEHNGLKVFLEPRAQGMLANTTIDFQDGRGFMITGMQQQSSCGSCSC